jgi:hypothetical protein
MKSARSLASLAFGGAGVAAYVLVVRGQLVLDVGVGRRSRPLGPVALEVNAPPATVFDVVAGPYLGRAPKAMEAKLKVIERGEDLVLAEHFTQVNRWLTATTLEMVHFQRPSRVSFRLLRGPVPFAEETFEIEPRGDNALFTYSGRLGTDFWALGQWWANAVAKRWEKAVEVSIAGIRAEAERRSAAIRAPLA